MDAQVGMRQKEEEKGRNSIWWHRARMEMVTGTGMTQVISDIQDNFSPVERNTSFNLPIMVATCWNHLLELT